MVLSSDSWALSLSLSLSFSRSIDRDVTGEKFCRVGDDSSNPRHSCYFLLFTLSLLSLSLKQMKITQVTMDRSAPFFFLLTL